MQQEWKILEIDTENFLEEIVITDYNEDLDLDCPIILKYILKK
jgi:hypothetical protein